MVIPVRNTEPLLRWADDLGKLLPPRVPRHLLLRALACGFGYPSWEALVAASSSAAAPFAFDQDLSYEQLVERRVAHARLMVSSLEVPFATAMDLAQRLAPTRDFVRNWQGVRQPHGNEPAELRVQAEYPDDWWVSSVEMEHPLAPPGFDVGTMINCADRARRLLSGMQLADMSSLQVLVTSARVHPWSALASPVHVSRNAAWVIAPVAWAFVFEKRNVPAMRRELWQTQYASLDEARSAITRDLADYDRLRAAAVSVGARPKSAQQFPVSMRAHLGLSPLWPLRPVLENDIQRRAWTSAELQALNSG